MFFTRLLGKHHHPHCPRQQAEVLAEILINILKEHNALTPGDFWRHAELQGIRSKTHMKQLLQWMRDQRMVRTEPVGDSHVYLLREEPLPKRPQIQRQDVDVARRAAKSSSKNKEVKQQPELSRISLWVNP